METIRQKYLTANKYNSKGKRMKTVYRTYSKRAIALTRSAGQAIGLNWGKKCDHLDRKFSVRIVVRGASGRFHVRITKKGVVNGYFSVWEAPRTHAAKEADHDSVRGFPGHCNCIGRHWHHHPIGHCSSWRWNPSRPANWKQQLQAQRNTTGRNWTLKLREKT